ncbi:Fur family transcriptional regulator, ferric uptake regulator [Acetitomaculum ruminis DSM 5522]|uniref:Fur family transcriptional regulator, ferric uptake regulator n=1 Tax=Acetitomaculum ruminis DSM 5522 TaxID=1120918 RepID=A0A1I0VK86_9FIRM|nr:transcriptional repressor [Acetitomaculum ruminis]SFA76815.1 Fur family transcriptional regulator, ferric uptake regulator [Acetitomaculum ruminis DSM 5522]
MRKEYSTKSRKIILEYMENNKDKHFTAADINDYLSKNNISINLATVYRNLDKYTEEGLLMKYKSLDGKSFLYQFINKDSKCFNHLHMQCKNCGKIIHMECDFMEDISTHLYNHHGFKLSCDGSVLMGICKECERNL